jgi:hypothetical protein
MLIAILLLGGGTFGAVLNDPHYSLHKPAAQVKVYAPEYTKKEKADSRRYYDQIDNRLYWNRWRRW